MASFIDITEKKQAEKELIQAIMIIEVYAGTVSMISWACNFRIIPLSGTIKPGMKPWAFRPLILRGRSVMNSIGRDVPCVPVLPLKQLHAERLIRFRNTSQNLANIMNALVTPFSMQTGAELGRRTLHDITVQKRAEEAHRESEERFRHSSTMHQCNFLHELR
jgi:PAS domain-containing protein